MAPTRGPNPAALPVRATRAGSTHEAFVAAPGMVVGRTAHLAGAAADGPEPGVKDAIPNAIFAKHRLFGLHSASVLSASPLAGEPSTGEPDAGDPHVRFGGRGRRNQSTLPTPTRASDGTWILDSRLRGNDE
jgi:hypothetical protein